MPAESKSMWEMLVQQASTVWAESVRPPSKMVNEAITGSERPRSAKVRSMACRQALSTSVSKAVSASRRSTPPSMSASICSR